MAKYEVIAPRDIQQRPTYWDGQNLVAPGTIVDIDPDVIKVGWDSKALKPIDDAPVWKRDKVSGELVVVPKKAPKGG